MSTMVCSCDEWKANIEEVDRPRWALNARNPGSGLWDYKGVPFKFCPWCSCILTTECVLPEQATT